MLAALDGDLPELPDDLPVLDILDAPAITAGEAARFPLKLDKPSPVDNVIAVTINGVDVTPTTIPAGSTSTTLVVPTGAEAGARTLEATLATTPEAVVTIGRDTATCDVQAAAPPNGGNGGGGDGDLEAIDRNAVQVGIVIDAQQRQTVVGHGFGLGSHSNAVAGKDLVRQHAKADLRRTWAAASSGCTIRRKAGFVTSYKPSVDVALAHGVKHILCTGYMYRAKMQPGGAGQSPQRCAQGRASRLPTPVFKTSPTATQLNAVTGNWVAAYRDLREQLDPRIAIIANEWRHPEKGVPEFDGLKAGGALRHVVAGALHIYDKAGNPALYDQRWLTADMPIWSCETGDGASPKTQARYVAGIAHRLRGRDRPHRPCDARDQARRPEAVPVRRGRQTAGLDAVLRADRALGPAGDGDARRDLE